LKLLAEDLDIPEVPIPRRMILAQKKRIAALKRAQVKGKVSQKIAKSKK
jgi:hypothetical protein